MGNGVSVRRIAMMPGRHASTVGTPSCATNRAWPRISPTRTARGGAAATRTGTARSAATRPNARPSPPSRAREPQETVDETDNRPMRALGHRTPAEAFADEPLESAENKDVALTNRQREQSLGWMSPVQYRQSQGMAA
ncbi:hypothetical protein ACEWF3_04565 [Bifidobacterium breve]